MRARALARTCEPSPALQRAPPASPLQMCRQAAMMQLTVPSGRALVEPSRSGRHDSGPPSTSYGPARPAGAPRACPSQRMWARKRQCCRGAGGNGSTPHVPTVEVGAADAAAAAAAKPLVWTKFVAETLLPTKQGKFRLRGYRHTVSRRTPPLLPITGHGSPHLPVRLTPVHFPVCGGGLPAVHPGSLFAACAACSWPACHPAVPPADSCPVRCPLSRRGPVDRSGLPACRRPTAARPTPNPQ